MKRVVLALVVVGSLAATGRVASAQVAGGPVLPYWTQAYYGGPGYYGTTYGVASYGLRQTYTTFTSPYQGGGYSYGYAPATTLPGPWGTALWSPTGRADQFVWRSPYYGTFGIPSAPSNVPLPPIGVYAPNYGPGLAPAVYGW